MIRANSSPAGTFSVSARKHDHRSDRVCVQLQLRGGGLTNEQAYLLGKFAVVSLAKVTDRADIRPFSSQAESDGIPLRSEMFPAQSTAVPDCLQIQLGKHNHGP
jgi:hypothetical protein